MGKPGKRHFYQGLRFKLLLVSLTLLALPWSGYRYLTEMETFLRHAQQQQLLDQAELAANLLRPELAERLQVSNQLTNQPLTNAFYAHPLQQQVQLDGYPDEWQPLLAQRRRFLASESNPQAVAFDLLLGYRDDWLFLFIDVDDAERIYATADKDPAAGDHLLLALPGSNGRTRQYLIGTPAPGWVVARDRQGGQTRADIRGEWQETARGYSVELRLPLSAAADRLSVAVVDIDAAGQTMPSGIAATSGLQQSANLSLIVLPSTIMAQRLSRLGMTNTRIRVIDRQRLVIAQSGVLNSLGSLPGGGPLSRLLGLLLPLTDAGFRDPRENLGRLDGPEIRRALKGTPSVYRHRGSSNAVTSVSAAYPIQQESLILGAMVMEQTSDEILLLQQAALERLLKTSLALFLLTLIALLVFTARLTGRITRLSHKVNNAVTPEGRIHHSIRSEQSADEIGDLERRFASVMGRLQGYNQYLEAMGSRLAHEFRTPLAMVKSSLENLEQDSEPVARRRYLGRAMEGAGRLSLILERMREATRLEQTLQQVEQETVNLGELLGSMTEGYNAAYPQCRFDYRSPDASVYVHVAPELILQALDKLVGNAVDFHHPGTVISLALTVCDEATACLRVTNQGPSLPHGMEQQLFHSMVSIRDKSDVQPHLGLGLYLVKLIAEFHQGQVEAGNTRDGVCLTLRLPIVQPAGLNYKRP